jgi:hypothetical protein
MDWPPDCKLPDQDVRTASQNRRKPSRTRPRSSRGPTGVPCRGPTVNPTPNFFRSMVRSIHLYPKDF